MHIKPTISKEVLILQNEINSVNLSKETPDFCTSLPKLTWMKYLTLMLFFFSSLSNNSANFSVSRECIYEKISSASLILFDCSLPTK